MCAYLEHDDDRDRDAGKTLNIIAWVVAIIVAAFLFGLVFMANKAKAAETDLTAANIIELTNESRAAAHLPALRENGKLDASAAAKAANLLKDGHFAHTSTIGIGLRYWLKSVGYKYLVAGENLGETDSWTAQDLEEAFIASPTHRANILNKNYRDIGVAVAAGIIDGQEETVVVVHFGRQ